MKLAQAINAAFKCEQRVKNGSRPLHASASMTLDEAFETIYLPSIHRDGTRKTQMSRFDAHIRYAIGHRPLHLITSSDLVALLDGLKPSRYCRRAIQCLKPSTYNRVVDLLKSIFRKFFELDLIECNIAKALQKRPERNQRTRILRDDELGGFASALDKAPTATRLLISLLFLTGMRLGEALTARWDFVDLDRRTLRLPDTKSGRPRVVLLSDEACAVCMELQAIRRNAFLFPGKGRGPMSRPSRQISALFAAAGMEGFWVHDLRRTFATRAAEVLPMHAVSALLGHSSTAVTERYLVTTDQRLHDGAAAVGQQFAQLIDTASSLAS